MNKPVVQVDSLVKEYAELKAVNGISFEVYEGEVFAFLGPNGAGKPPPLKFSNVSAPSPAEPPKSSVST